MKKIVPAPYIDQTARWVNGCESISSVMLLQAVGSIMKDAVQLVARKARSKVRHPMRYGLTPPPPANRKGGGL